MRGDSERGSRGVTVRLPRERFIRAHSEFGNGRVDARVVVRRPIARASAIENETTG